jgi:DNA-binding response OmpR family regulator
VIKTILVVDDDVQIVRMVRMALVQEGYEALAAYDGVAALQAIDAGGVDLVLLDVGMPLLDGWDVCRRIRELSGVPIIFLTARSRDREVVAGLRLGADDYIRKPFCIDELVARIQNVLRRSERDRAKQDRVYDDGRLRFDPTLRTLAKDGVPVELTPTESDVLTCLVRHAGEVVPYARIIDEVWDRDPGRDKRTIAVYIRYLRQKIEDDASRPRFVVTEVGKGYMLVPWEEPDERSHSRLDDNETDEHRR